MKIRKITPDNHPKVSGLLRQAFPGSNFEMQLIENLRKKERNIHEWAGIHANKIIAYIAFSNAYNGTQVCGLHLAPLAVKPDFQKQGIGSELIRFTLRQKVILKNPLFVLGSPHYYKKFGFEPCTNPLCPFDKNNAHFLSIRNSTSSQFTIGYEPEFLTK